GHAAGGRQDRARAFFRACLAFFGFWAAGAPCFRALDAVFRTALAFLGRLCFAGWRTCQCRSQNRSSNAGLPDVRRRERGSAASWMLVGPKSGMGIDTASARPEESMGIGTTTISSGTPSLPTTTVRAGVGVGLGVDAPAASRAAVTPAAAS